MAWLTRGQRARQAAADASAAEYGRANGVHLGLTPDPDRCWPGCPHTWGTAAIAEWGQGVVADYLADCGPDLGDVDNLRALRDSIRRVSPRTTGATVLLAAIGERLTEMGA